MISIERMRVSTRLLFAGLAVVLGLTLVGAYTVTKIRSEALTAHSDRIKNLVEASTGIIGNSHARRRNFKPRRPCAVLGLAIMTIISSMTLTVGR